MNRKMLAWGLLIGVTAWWLAPYVYAFYKLLEQ